MHIRSLKLQPSSSSSAKGHTEKHEEHARNHEDLLALWVAFNAQAMHQPTSCTLSMFQSLSILWPVLFKNLLGKESSDQRQKKSLASSFAVDLHEMSRWQQHYVQQLDLSKVWSTSSLTAPNSGKGDTLAITTCQTKVTRGRLTLIRIEDHKEQICRLSRPAWLVSVFSMVQCVPTAGRCPKILFLIVTRSLACFCATSAAGWLVMLDGLFQSFTHNRTTRSRNLSLVSIESVNIEHWQAEYVCCTRLI